MKHDVRTMTVAGFYRYDTYIALLYLPSVYLCPTSPPPTPRPWAECNAEGFRGNKPKQEDTQGGALLLSPS